MRLVLVSTREAKEFHLSRRLIHGPFRASCSALTGGTSFVLIDTCGRMPGNTTKLCQASSYATISVRH